MAHLSAGTDSAGGERGEKIAFLDLRRRGQREELRERIGAVLDSGRLLDGPELAALETEWARFSGGAHAVGVGSGTDALRLTLAALDIGPDDEVIVPAFTAIPTVAAVCATGAVPVPVDVDPHTAAIDHSSARAALTSRTRALIAVHLYGRPCALPDLGVPVIEDAAHAHGALRRVEGVAAAYSFYPTKNLGSVGDGGAVVTDDRRLAERVASLRAHGRDREGSFREASTNSRLSELGAAAIRVALPGLEEGNRRRRDIAAAYRSAAPELGWQPDHEDHVHHLCVVRVKNRQAFRNRLPCETAVHYPRAVVDEPAYRPYLRREVPVARRWADECVSLPCYPELEEGELELICAALAADSESG
jgi:dTDP-4-amino-4,6-dideoxygalactose transaminase